MNRKRFIPGRFLRIKLEDGSYAYGRLRNFQLATFYNLRTDEPIADLDKIANSSILFTVALHKSVLGEWEIIGKKPLEEKLKQPFIQFWQDIGDYRNCKIFDDAGNERPARPEECEGLERWSVWEAKHVEDRLLDTFLEKPNVWVESMKVRYTQ